MARDRFWSGFGLGTLTGVVGGITAFVAASGRASSHDKRILRLESSVQIARPVEEAFAEWSKFELFPEKISAIKLVAVNEHARIGSWKSMDVRSALMQKPNN